MSITMQTIFARFVAVLMGILAIFNGGNMDNIRMELKNEVTTESACIEVEVFNYTGKKLTADEYFSLEKNENGEWVKVDFAGDYKINDVAFSINNLRTAVFRINISDAFGKNLGEGEYRLSKSFGADTDKSLIFTVSEA